MANVVSCKSFAALELSKLLALEWTTVVAAIVAIVHLTAPMIFEKSRRHTRIIGSLGAGMAVSYLFLHLLEELDLLESESDAWFSDYQHMLLLTGFVLYYGSERLAISRSEHGLREYSETIRFTTSMIARSIYSWLFVFSLPVNIQEDNLLIVPGLLAILLHLVHDDLELVEEYGERYRRYGRYILTAAVVSAWIGDLCYFGDSIMASGILTALLAGAVLYRTLSNPTIHQHRASFGWFAGGILLFVLLHLATK